MVTAGTENAAFFNDVWTWYHGNHGTARNDTFENRLLELSRDNEWVRGCDLYVAALAFRVDLISIFTNDDAWVEICRPLADPFLFNCVPKVTEWLSSERVVGPVYIRCINRIHFTCLKPIVSHIDRSHRTMLDEKHVKKLMKESKRSTTPQQQTAGIDLSYCSEQKNIDRELKSKSIGSDTVAKGMDHTVDDDGWMSYDEEKKDQCKNMAHRNGK